MCHGPLSHPRGLVYLRVAEEGLHCACLICILCGLEGDLGYLEEELVLSMVFVVQTAWLLGIRYPRGAVLNAPAILVVMISCMGREVDGCSFGVFLQLTPYNVDQMRGIINDSKVPRVTRGACELTSYVIVSEGRTVTIEYLL